jgi:hypothetical protein
MNSTQLVVFVLIMGDRLLLVLSSPTAGLQASLLVIRSLYVVRLREHRNRQNSSKQRYNAGFNSTVAILSSGLIQTIENLKEIILRLSDDLSS